MNKIYYIVDEPEVDPSLVYENLEAYNPYDTLEAAQKAVARCHKDTSFATYFRVVEAETGGLTKFTRTITIERVS